MNPIKQFMRLAFILYTIMSNVTCSKSQAIISEPDSSDTSNFYFANGDRFYSM